MTQWAACIGGAALHKLPLTSPAVAPSRCSAGQHPSSRSPQLPSSAAVSHLWRDGDPTMAPTWKHQHQHQQPLVTPRAGNGARRMAWAGRAQFRRALFRGWCCCGCSSWCCFRWPELAWTCLGCSAWCEPVRPSRPSPSLCPSLLAFQNPSSPPPPPPLSTLASSSSTKHLYLVLFP